MKAPQEEALEAAAKDEYFRRTIGSMYNVDRTSFDTGWQACAEHNRVLAEREPEGETADNPTPPTRQQAWEWRRRALKLGRAFREAQLATMEARDLVRNGPEQVGRFAMVTSLNSLLDRFSAALAEQGARLPSGDEGPS